MLEYRFYKDIILNQLTFRVLILKKLRRLGLLIKLLKGWMFKRCYISSSIQYNNFKVGFFVIY